MKYVKLSTNWNADPNSPNEKIVIESNRVTLEFNMNYYIYDHFKEGDRGHIKFEGCHKLSYNTTNDEGYFRGQYRFNQLELPWGQFYEVESDWENNFHKNNIVLGYRFPQIKYKHFIFFLRDNTFECIAENFKFIGIN